jgi:ATP-dependent Clp protease ATP-binding subunit ClpA
MNEFQSPYIEGQVITSADEPSLHGFESTQTLSISSKKIQGCSKSASDCLQKTKQLAHEFNHGTYCAAHLVLAMTLIPNATRQFDLRKVDIDKAFRAAMHALIEMERGSPNHRNIPRPSEELSMIVSLAEEVARNRDNQEVSVDDLLTAVDRMPEETLAAQLLRGERKGVPDLMIREALQGVSDNVGTQLRNLEQELRNLEQEVRSTSAVASLRYDLNDLKSEVMRQCGELDRKLGEVAGRLSQRAEPAASVPPASPEPPPPPRPVGGIWDRLTSG